MVADEKVFAGLSLRSDDFVVEWGRGKSVQRQQRLVWMKVRHNPSGRVVEGKISTSKKKYELKRQELLCDLLRKLTN